MLFIRLHSLRSVLLILVAALAASCATEQSIRQQAETLASQGAYASSISTLESAVAERPHSPTLRAAMIATKARVLSELLQQADRLVQQGRVPEARQLLEQAVALKVDNGRALQLLNELQVQARQDTALAEAKRYQVQGDAHKALSIVEQALKDNVRHRELSAFQRRLMAEQRAKLSAASALELSEIRPISLDFKEAGLRSVLDIVSRNSGVNFVFDKDIRSDARVTLYLQDASVEKAVPEPHRDRGGGRLGAAPSELGR
jgi:general secretion pathway protein D